LHNTLLCFPFVFERMNWIDAGLESYIGYTFYLDSGFKSNKRTEVAVYTWVLYTLASAVYVYRMNCCLHSGCLIFEYEELHTLLLVSAYISY